MGGWPLAKKILDPTLQHLTLTCYIICFKKIEKLSGNMFDSHMLHNLFLEKNKNLPSPNGSQIILLPLSSFHITKKCKG